MKDVEIIDGEITIKAPRRDPPSAVAAMLAQTLPWADIKTAVAAIRDGPADNRPKIAIMMAEQEIWGLVDTGANMSVMDYSLFVRLFGETATVNPKAAAMKVSSVTGKPISVRDYVEIDVKIKGQTMRRPFLLVDGLRHQKCVLGCDFLQEERVMIDGETNELTFKPPPQASDDWETAAVQVRRRTTVFPRSIQHILVEATVGGRTLPANCTGIVEATRQKNLTIWESLNTTQDRGQMYVAVVNMSRDKICLKGGDVLGQMRATREDEEMKPLNDATLASVFGHMKPDKPDPPRGALTRPTPAEKAELLRRLQIKAGAAARPIYEDLFVDYHDVCSKDKFDLGFSDVIEHKIVMKDEDPVHARQFRVPFAHEEVLNGYVEELLRQGAIEVSRSPYNSPIFCVTKKLPPDAPPGSTPPLRCVLDFRQVNAKSLPDRYSIKEVRQCIDEVGRSASDVFTTIDLTAGFWQQRLEEGSRQYTAFSVPGKGARYQWKVTPMGLQGSPASFSRLMDYVIRELDGVLTYVDDVLAHTKGHIEHAKVVENVLWRLRKYGLKLNVSKTIIAADEVQYLGYTISGRGVSPSVDKIKALRELPVPKDVRAVREFIGLANYFRFLIPQFARRSAPLTALTTKASAGFIDGQMPDAARKAFEDLRDELISAPVVQYPRRQGHYRLHTDGCTGDSVRPGGMGACLMQVQDGQERVIAYASRSLRDHEKNYGAYLVEMAAAVFGIEHFDTYLIGRTFTLCIDHRPLERLGTIHQKTLNRLQQLMLEYSFDIVYRRGPDHVVPDCLSRNVPPEEAAAIRVVCAVVSTGADVRKLQEACPDISDVRLTLQGKPTIGVRSAAAQARLRETAKQCKLVDGFVFRRIQLPGRERLVLFAPPDIRRIVMLASHSTRTGGHGGVDRTVTRVQLEYWWPGLVQDVRRFVAACVVCRANKTPLPAKAPLNPLPVPTQPNDRVHVDLFGPLRTSTAGNKYIVVMTDAFTKYAELASITDKTAQTVAQVFLERWICRFSAPTVVVTDQGKEFCNKLLERVCELWDIEKIRTTAFHPQTNSAAESYNRTIIKYMRAVLQENATLDWEELLPMLMLAYNCHVHRSTGETPFFLTFLHDPRLPVFDVARPRQFYNHGFVEDAYAVMQTAFAAASASMLQASEKSKLYFDKKAKERSFKAGDRVFCYFPNTPIGINPKFHTKWKPYTVVKPVGQVNLLCQADGQGRSKPILIHIDRAIARQGGQPGPNQAPMDRPDSEQGQSWAAEMEMVDQQQAAESRRQLAREEDEEHWEEDDWEGYALVTARAGHSAHEPRRAEQDDPGPAAELSADDPRKADAWFSLGRLIWQRTSPIQTRSTGPVEDRKLPAQCPTHSSRRRPRSPSSQA